MIQSVALAALSLGAGVYAQQAGTLTAEVHPKLTVSTCVAGGTCTTEQHTIVLDANWRWLHSTTGSTNCYTGNTWDATLCPDAVTCAANCALDGADYTGTYGISASGNALSLQLVTGSNSGSRVYLMDTTDTKYQEFNLLNKEFTVDVDVSKLPCGLNGALYFSQMDADGGEAKYPGNKAGAKYGTGYCDSQCPRDIKFIGGKANSAGWTPATNSANTGKGTTDRMGNTSFYGPGKTIDTTKKITVVTQFITSDGTATGDLTEIRRFYVQDGVTYANSQSDIAGISGNSITEAYCKAQKSVFGDTDTFDNQGGLKAMGEAFKAGMVLVLSIWDDYAVNMLWLDSDYPTTAPTTQPGVARGSCSTTSGNPKDVESQSPGATVVFSNIKTGPIGSTFNMPAGGSGSSPPVSSSSSAPAPPVSSSTSVAPPPKSSSTTTTPPPASSTTSTTTKAPASSTSSSSGACATHYGQCGKPPSLHSNPLPSESSLLTMTFLFPNRWSILDWSNLLCRRHHVQG
ncbi:hypothetical protein LTR62_000482 [Meristemomyces frigidus]|uniref:Glucanase n=1 Tax=Meristemomyces frigidus TaxID=1508187 RepID=A0AAN7YII3_9PEZI|nr:hypothetical protein LTR62_000482 [Meristemomyces frigidus]